LGIDSNSSEVLFLAGEIARDNLGFDILPDWPITTLVDPILALRENVNNINLNSTSLSPTLRGWIL
jgi:hypothetical protein